jgi:hypothetical protein
MLEWISRTASTGTPQTPYVWISKVFTMFIWRRVILDMICAAHPGEQKAKVCLLPESRVASRVEISPYVCLLARSSGSIREVKFMYRCPQKHSRVAQT